MPAKRRVTRQSEKFGGSPAESSNASKLLAIGFDSKRDKSSLVYEERDVEGEVKLYKTTRTVDHLTFTIEAGIIHYHNILKY